jgi:hypothetical protein
MSLLGTRYRAVGRVAFIVGAAVAIVLVLQSRVPAAPIGNGLEVRATANLTGRLDVRPFGTVLKADELLARPGRDVAGGWTMITNQTPRPLLLQIRSRPGLSELDDLLRVHVELGGHKLVDTTLRRFRDWVGWNMVLTPAEPQKLVVRVRLWGEGLPRSRYAGRVVSMPLEFRTTFAKKGARL